MEEGTSLVWRKAGKAGEGSNPANSADLLLLAHVVATKMAMEETLCVPCQTRPGKF